MNRFDPGPLIPKKVKEIIALKLLKIYGSKGGCVRFLFVYYNMGLHCNSTGVEVELCHECIGTRGHCYTGERQN